ncbi:MAG: leucine-rich repeat protein [Muribaculaceae bacterium]|nr:leucine-rich repeat protein [Muribaculaceae bacterium]
MRSFLTPKFVLLSVLIVASTFKASAEFSTDGLLEVRAFNHGDYKAYIPDSAWIVKAKPNYSGAACLTSVTVEHYYLEARYDAMGHFIGYDTIRYNRTYPVTAMANNAFAGSKISSFYLPGNIKFSSDLTTLGSNETPLNLSGCINLTSVTIPSRVTSVNFGGCTSLTGATLPIGCESWNFSNTAVTNIDFLPAGITHMMGFAGNNIPIVNIPGTVKGIYDYSFKGCPISKLTIPESVEYIGDDAFLDCGEIKELVWNAKNCVHSGVGKSLQGIIDHIYAVPFKGTSFESVVVGRNVEYIGSYLLGNSGIYEGEQVIVPVKKLTWNAINCGYNQFYTRDLEQVIIGNEVQAIPSEFVWSSKITEITIPNSVTSIGGLAFAYCSKLSTLRLNAKNIMFINNYYLNVFGGCGNLSHIIIGDEVESISEIVGSYGLFNIGDDDNNIQTVTSYAIVPPVITAKCFTQKTYENAVLEVPAESLEAYRNAEGWKNFFKFSVIEEIPGGETDKLCGDVNGDGKVTIDDVTTLISYLLSGNVSPFDAGNADCNGDGRVSIDDVTALINYLLTSKW